MNPSSELYAVPPPPVGELASEAVEAMGELIELHLALATAEVGRDLRRFAWAAAPVVLALPLAGLGYVWLNVAASFALAAWLGYAAGVAVVGLANAVLGAAFLATGLYLMRGVELDTTLGVELGRSVGALRPASGEPTEVRLGR